jgi:fatty-acyl-CoA synthase
MAAQIRPPSCHPARTRRHRARRRPTAFVRSSSPGSIDKAELFSYVREHLAPHKTPSRWFLVDDFPLTGSGKIQKFKLREQWVNGERTEL